MRASSVVLRWFLAAGLAWVAMAAAQAPGAQQAGASDADTGASTIVMVLWRGCEDACRGFMDFVADSGIRAEYVLRDAEGDRTRLPGFVEEVDAMRPDLLVTWGTSVTLGMIGTMDGDGRDVVSGVPTVFMIVADPVGARIVESYDRSGRTFVTGTRNRVPEDRQLRMLQAYRPFTRIGLIYNDTEANALLKAQEVRDVAAAQGIDVVERVLANGADGKPRVEDIPLAIAEIASQDVGFLYVGSSSFIVEHADLFTSEALRHRLPVATAYEAMVRSSGALIAMASPYYNVGQLAGYQAERILRDRRTPGDLEIAGLDRFTVLINIETARSLDLFPPLLLLRYAEVVGGPQ